jgi:hypothetical protein
MGGRSTLSFGKDPQLLGRLQKFIGMEIKFLHVVRNPYDNVATMHRHRQAGPNLEDNVDRYRRMCEINLRLAGEIPKENLLEIRLETLIARPKETLADICQFFDVSADPEYLEACAGIVSPSPSRTRHDIEWTPTEKARVAALIRECPHLDGYSFEC